MVKKDRKRDDTYLNYREQCASRINIWMRNFARPGALSHNDWRVWLEGKLKRKGGISRKKCGKNNGSKQVNGKCLCY